jgi:plastocyanin
MSGLNSLRCSFWTRSTAVLAILIVPQAAGAQWRATVGAQGIEPSSQVLAFLPNEIWIHAGDNITWTFEGAEIHTVTFLATFPAPQVRPPFQVGCPGFSGEPISFDGAACVTTPPLVKGAMFKVSFPSQGNFKLVCLVHPDMTGTVHVLDPAQALPHNQIFYDAEAAAQAQALLFNHDADPEDEDVVMPGHVIAGTGQVSANPAGFSSLSVERFMGKSMVIHAGQTV